MTSRRIIFALAIACALVVGFDLMMDRTDASEYIFKDTPSWKDKTFSEQARLLYATLESRGLKVEANQEVDFGKVDLIVHDAKLFIQVDGKQHYLHKGQVQSDLWENYYALEEGYLTLRIPNIAIEQSLDETVEVILQIAESRSAQPTEVSAD